MSSCSKLKLNSMLKEVRKFIPLEFNQKLRPITDLAFWKASEHRLFLLYVSIVLLKRKSILCTQRYNHFLKFSIVVRYLLQPNANRDTLTFCHKLLCEFVNDSVSLYGKRFVAYNVHSVMSLQLQRVSNLALSVFVEPGIATLCIAAYT